MTLLLRSADAESLDQKSYGQVFFRANPISVDIFIATSRNLVVPLNPVDATIGGM